MIIEVVAAIIRRDSQMLITRRFKDVHLPGLWEFPGGKVEPNESLQAALEREILEELGVKVRIEDEFHVQVPTGQADLATIADVVNHIDRVSFHRPLRPAPFHNYMTALLNP